MLENDAQQNTKSGKHQKEFERESYGFLPRVELVGNYKLHVETLFTHSVS
jgi:hypothetical protein